MDWEKTMIKKPKRYNTKKNKYAVYYRASYYVEGTYEDLGHLGLYDWQYLGETTAVSEAQAINNVRYRLTAEGENDRIRDGKCVLDFKAEIIK